MLLPHPKYKGPFIALPAPSFSSKLITSGTWMTLESEAPPKPPLGFSEERFPSPNTAPALSQREDAVQGFASLGHTPAMQHKLLPPSHPHTLLCSHVGPPVLPQPVSGQQHCSLHTTPHVLSPEAAVAGPGHAPGPCCLHRHALHAAPQAGQLSSWPCSCVVLWLHAPRWLRLQRLQV